MSDEKRIAALEVRVAALEALLGQVRAVFTGEPSADGAPDDELDGKYGDPVLARDLPAKYWGGQSFKGKRLSQCPPEFLEAYAKYKAVCAKMKRKDIEKNPSDPKNAANAKYAEYDEKDRQRAIGWRRRLLAGWTPPPAPQASENPFDRASEDESWRESVGFSDVGDNPFASSSGSGFANGDADSFNFGANLEEEGPL